MASIDKQIAATGIELWSETESEGANLEEGQPDYLTVANDAGLHKDSPFKPLKVSVEENTKISQAQTEKILHKQSFMKSILQTQQSTGPIKQDESAAS